MVTDWQLEHVALALFRSNMADYEFPEDMLLIEWLDEGTHAFWIEQARTAIEALQNAPEEPERESVNGDNGVT